MREIIGRLDHQFINDLEPFRTVNPSAENLAKYFYDEMQRGLKDLPPGARITEYDHLGNGYEPGKVHSGEVILGK